MHVVNTEFILQDELSTKLNRALLVFSKKKEKKKS